MFHEYISKSSYFVLFKAYHFNLLFLAPLCMIKNTKIIKLVLFLLLFGNTAQRIIVHTTMSAMWKNVEECIMVVIATTKMAPLLNNSQMSLWGRPSGNPLQIHICCTHIQTYGMFC